MEKKYDFLIVGGGLSGCVFAFEATKRGKKCVIVERREALGGNIIEKNIEGIDVHQYGAHIFRTNDKNIWQYVLNFGEMRNFINTPIANYNGELYNLPFNMNTFYALFGSRTPEQAKQDIEKTKVHFDNPCNLEEWALSTVGEVIYTKFIKDYTKKQWGKECKDLPMTIMRRIPLRFTFNNNYYNSEYQGIPKEGYKSWIQKMTYGCKVVCYTDYKDIKDKVDAKQIIYTGALDELYDYCFGALDWRSVRFEHEIIDTENFQGVAVQNYTGKEPFTRIIEHKHFTKGTQKHTVITKEYPEKWEKGKAQYYPINDSVNEARQKKYAEKAKNDGYIILGELAEHQYYDMEDVIKNGIELARQVVNDG